MHKIIGWIPLVFLFSCGESSEDDSTINTMDANQSVDMPAVVLEDQANNALAPIDFNNELTALYSEVLDQVNFLFASDSTNIKKNHGNVLFEIALKRKDLNHLPVPEGGGEFKKAMDDLFGFYESEFAGDFMTVIDILEKSNGSRSTSEEELLESYDKKFALEEGILFKKLNAEQETFAAKSNFQIEG